MPLFGNYTWQLLHIVRAYQPNMSYALWGHFDLFILELETMTVILTLCVGHCSGIIHVKCIIFSGHINLIWDHVHSWIILTILLPLKL